VILQLIAKILLAAGTAFLLLGSIGVNRFPDFYARAHAATKPDTLGLGLCMLGLALYDGITLDSGKLLLIVLFVWMANPAASHALGRAAIDWGLVPWVRKGERQDDR